MQTIESVERTTLTMFPISGLQQYDSEDQHPITQPQLQAVYCGRLLEVRYGINCSPNVATANLPCSCIEACILYQSLDQLPQEDVSIDTLKTISPERFCLK
jgi:hypothetical protein